MSGVMHEKAQRGASALLNGRDVAHAAPPHTTEHSIMETPKKASRSERGHARRVVAAFMIPPCESLRSTKKGETAGLRGAISTVWGKTDQGGGVGT